MRRMDLFFGLHKCSTKVFLLRKELLCPCAVAVYFPRRICTRQWEGVGQNVTDACWPVAAWAAHLWTRSVCPQSWRLLNGTDPGLARPWSARSILPQVGLGVGVRVGVEGWGWSGGVGVSAQSKSTQGRWREQQSCVTDVTVAGRSSWAPSC